MWFLVKVAVGSSFGEDELLLNREDERQVIQDIIASPLYKDERIRGISMRRVDTLEERETEATELEQYIRDHPEEVET